MFRLEINDPYEYLVALYVRLSKEDVDLIKSGGIERSESIKNQIKMLEDFAEFNNLKIIDIYTDDGYSGTNFERPAFIKMIKDIEKKKINMVITKDLSRLGRDYIETGLYLEKYFPEHNVRYIAINDDIDTGLENHSSNDMSPFKSVVNDMYARDTSKKIRSAFQTKMKDGQFIGSHPMFGYKKDPNNKNKLVIDKDASIIVKRIFNLALEGFTGRKIASILNDEKVITPLMYRLNKKTVNHPSMNHEYSHLWKPEYIRKMLKNQVYIGNLVQGKTKKVNYKSKKITELPQDKWIVIENTHEPIIDKDTFYKVQSLIKARQSTRVKTHDYLLKGLLVCHECQKKLNVFSTHRTNYKEYYIRCLTYQRFSKQLCYNHCMQLKTIDKAVLDNLREICEKYINRNSLINLGIEQLQNNQTGNENEKYLAELSIQLETINNHIDTLYSDKVNKFITPEDFSRLYANKIKEKEQLKKRIEYVKSSIKETECNNNEEYINKLVDEFLKMEKPTKLTLTSLIDRIEITKDKEILIYYKFSIFNNLNSEITEEKEEKNVNVS